MLNYRRNMKSNKEKGALQEKVLLFAENMDVSQEIGRKIRFF